MNNHARQIIQALIEVGSIAPDRVAAGLCAIGSSRREHVWIVRMTDGPSFVVKQASDPTGRRRLAREAAIYARLRGIERCHAPFLPGTVCYDDQRGLLILDYVEGASLAEISGTRDRNGTAPATELGRALAHLHQTGIDPLDPGLLAADPPWVLSIHRPDLNWYTHSSEASLRMRAIVQQHPELGRALDALRDAWTTNAIIHADLKLEHVIATRHGRGISIIDWERAQLGDAAWDIGSIFAACLLRWLRSIPLVAGTTPGDVTGLATVPIQRIQPAIAAFWNAYVEAVALEEASRRELLLTATRSTAAILIQREEEYLQSATATSSRTRLILQVSHNMLAQPDQGAAVLLGLNAEGGQTA